VTIDHTAGYDINKGRTAFIKERQPIIRSIVNTILTHLNRLLTTLAQDNGKSREDNIFILLITNLFARFISSGILTHIHTYNVFNGGNGHGHHGKGPTSHFRKTPSKSKSHRSHKKHHSIKDSKTPMDEEFFKLTEVALKFGVKCHLERLVELGAIDRVNIQEEGEEDETVYEKETSEPLDKAIEKEVDENITHLKKYVDRLHHLYEFLGISDHGESTMRSVSERSLHEKSGQTTRKIHRHRHNKKQSKRHQSVSFRSESSHVSPSANSSASATASQSNRFAALALSESPSASATASANANASTSTSAHAIIGKQKSVGLTPHKSLYSSRRSVSRRHSIGPSLQNRGLLVHG
jgi:hypothetical protein